MSELTLHFDGGCDQNPGGTATYGVVVGDVDGRQMLWGVVGIGQGMSNNVAEWTGLMVGLEYVKRFALDASVVSIFGDSKLVIEQVNRRWRCKQRHLVKLRDRCWEMLEELEDRGVTWTAVWILREQNSDADALTSKAYRGSKKKSVGGMEYLPFGKCVP